MDQRQNDSPADALVRFLNTLIIGREPRSVDELRESVQAMGMDPDRLLARAREQVARAREEARLSWATRARARLPEVRRRLRESKVLAGLSREDQLRRIREAAEGACGAGAREFAASFHKFEDLTDADLASLVEDIEALRLLEEGPPDDRA
jgi:hypothetical protein